MHVRAEVDAVRRERVVRAVPRNERDAVAGTVNFRVAERRGDDALLAVSFAELFEARSSDYRMFGHSVSSGAMISVTSRGSTTSKHG